MKFISIFLSFFLTLFVSSFFFFIPLFKSIDLKQYKSITINKRNGYIFRIEKQNTQIFINDQKLENNKYIISGLCTLKKINKINYGEFVLYENEKLVKLFERIIKNKRFIRKIYIPSGSNKFQTIEILNNAEKLFGPKISFDDLEEGSLFPETYHYFYGENRLNLLKIMRKKTEELLNQFWLSKNKNLPFKTKKEALVLASIIEKEAFLESDKSLIASVLLNRLRIGMKIQSDPTAQYANKLNNFLRKEKGLSEEKFDIQINSPYNTYFISGLPINPISNVSYSSLYAAFNPGQTDYLFFLSFPGEKQMIFSKDYDEHLTNVQILRKKQKELKMN